MNQHTIEKEVRATFGESAFDEVILAGGDAARPTDAPEGAQFRPGFAATAPASEWLIAARQAAQPARGTRIRPQRPKAPEIT